MAGLIPIRRTVEEIERANAELLRQHHEHLARWIAQRRPLSHDAENFESESSESLITTPSR